MLIFKNGTAIWYTGEGEVSFDGEGNPIASTLLENQSECFIETLTYNKEGRYEDGRYTNCSYSVLIDANSLPSDFNPKKIKITHNKLGVLGEFTVQRIEFFDLTQSAKLWV